MEFTHLKGQLVLLCHLGYTCLIDRYRLRRCEHWKKFSRVSKGGVLNWAYIRSNYRSPACSSTPELSEMRVVVRFSAVCVRQSPMGKLRWAHCYGEVHQFNSPW